MPDLLTHVLLAYAVCTGLSTRYEWGPAAVTAGMVGALLPDLNHFSVLAPPGAIYHQFGVLISWTALQTGGGVLLLILGGVVVAVPNERRRVFALLSVGAVSHLFTDALIRVPDGRSQSIFWPLTPYQPPTPGLYTSTDLWPLVVAASLAVAAWYWRQNQSHTGQSEQTN
ncbi:metal-dependent hydrolase [Halosimplex pelagicum]|uniref:Metal-dependent hydrolase n=1 Tax=Halosimplex pelagicum TaxID=869886 RepID=A0A7D5PA45_9EURY|nr:metal-dependent hydrolase [Halosimplex pelagicum]QLH81262.1 metal-dependent hydrolase [Halosimplex pelagicum]